MTNCNQAPLRTTPNSKYNERYYTTQFILDKALGHWPAILESLGVNDSYLKNKHGPCPACGGKDRFRFDNRDQRGTFFCNHCGSGDGVKLLQLCYGWSFVQTLHMVARIVGVQPDENYLPGPQHVSYYLNNISSARRASPPHKNVHNNRRKHLNITWKQAKPICIDDPVDCYLKSRGIELNRFPSILRFHPALPYYDDDHALVGRFPAMLAMAQDRNNHAVTIHRTYLGNGCKANVPKPKKLMSPITPGASFGAAIKLYEPVDGKLALAEGIETAFAFGIATKFPVWATISAGGMEKIILPPSVVDVMIAVDNDESGRGQAAAVVLAKRLLSEGRTVRRVIPPKVGQDFNDILLGAIL